MYQYPGIQRPLRRVGGCISGLVVLLLLAGVLGFFISRAHNGVSVSVGPHPTIIGDHCTGNVTIQAGPASRVTFMGIFPQYTQDSASDTIELTQCDGDITVIVPPEADLHMDVSDAITVLGVSGTMQLGTNGSRITLIGVTLEGKSKVDDNGGAVIFNGTIAQGSAPTISCNSGSMDLTLPASSSFSLKITGILGPLVSNFPGVQAPADSTSDVQLAVGSNPSAARLTLEVNDTDIILNKGA